MEAGDGVRLRAALWRPHGEPRGSVVLSPGRTEYVERYYEVVGEWLARGFVVLAHDWRGQGLSDRLHVDPLRGHARGWRAFVADHRRLLDVFADRLPEPRIALGHSMGGALVALAMMEGETRYAGAVLSAPMMGVRTGRRSAALVRRVAYAMMFAARGGGLALPAYDPLHDAFEANMLTHDRARFERGQALIAAEPQLRLGGPTWSWLAFAFALAAQLARPGGPERLARPLLVLTAGDERLCVNVAAEAFAARARHAWLVEIEGARHELLMETDPLRALAWARIDAFVDALAPARPGNG